MKILGLDIGTNSIGGALLNIEGFGEKGSIEWMGSRIIPLDGDSLSKFENGGQVETKAANRRMLRSSRRLKQRYKLRRGRLIKVFKILGWVTADFPIDFKQLSRSEDFRFDINQHLPISEESKKEAYDLFGTENISEDWIVYFLRQKALSEKITLHELARILYMLNQRRGFKSSRKDTALEVDDVQERWPKVEKWIEILKVSSITEVSKEKDKQLYQVIAGNYTGEIVRKNKPDWAGKAIELEITRKTTKDGKQTYSFNTPQISDWEKQKAALHKDVYEWIDKGLCRTIGEYFFVHLKDDKNYRIRQRIVERDLYKQELLAIWETQKKHYTELNACPQLDVIASNLYQHNFAKQQEIRKNDLLHVFANDIIYYQRALKSQKDSIDVCRFEQKEYKKDGGTVTVGVKVAPKSSPEFQEFRIWQDIHNLRIYESATVSNKNPIDTDITTDYLNSDVKASLYELFDQNNEISANAILKTIDKRFNTTSHKINLFANRDKLKGNETKAVIRKVFKKHGFEGEQLLADAKSFNKLWHILYSLSEEKEIKSALTKWNLSSEIPLKLPEDVINHLSKLPELPKQYAAYSSKAIKKLLPLMRCGKFWNAGDIQQPIIEKIERIACNEFDSDTDLRTVELIERFIRNNENYSSGMPVWLATYVVYGKHSERASYEKYTSYEDINVDKQIPANSLRNPFVEQVIRETLQLVKELCKKYGQPDEIHIELARELKKTAEEKAEISKANNNNLAEKERIKKLLIELKQGNPESLADIEKFRLWKANGGDESNQKFNELFNRQNAFVSASEIEKYRLWADQNHLSPYTGKAIPLSLLFNKAAYEVEHIFPRSRFFDDSFANKVICETGVNKEKDNRIARVFMHECSGRTFQRGGHSFTILNEDAYISHCKRVFKGKKLRNLLAEKIPEDFVQRQLNDTRYITKKLAELLYPIAKDKEGIVFTGGSISNELKNKWGLNTIWKEILKPRFERLEELTGEDFIMPDDSDVNKFHFAKDYKRVDHRHHALDALIIAATTREHIRYLNTLNALAGNEGKLPYNLVKKGIRDFIQPWPSFTFDAKQKLSELIVSHKATNRIVTKPFNRYLKWEKVNGEYKKVLKSQLPPENFSKHWTAVRKSMFKEPQGIIYLKEIMPKKLLDAISIQIEKSRLTNEKGKCPASYIYDQALRPIVKELIAKFNSDITAIKAHVKKYPLKDADGNIIDSVRVAVFKEYACKRVALDATFDEKKLSKIPYAHHSPGDGKKQTLAQILKMHLSEYGQGKPEIAFTGEGLDVLHKKLGYSLRKVTIYEAKDPETKFKGKYYETDKGGNVFFIIKEDRGGNRSMYTLPLLETIERLANKLPLADENDNYKYFTLSPNELVYVPEENENIKAIDWSDRAAIFDKVYKVVSFSKYQCFFIPHFVSKAITDDYKELGANNKSERAWNGTMIKNTCIKLQIDRLGNIRPAER